MARTDRYKIERKSGVRYTTHVIEGNTVRVTEEMPRVREGERRSAPVRKVHETHESALIMNYRYVLFLTVAAIAVVAICIHYLKLQAVSTKLQKKTVALQTQLKDLEIENDIVYNEIISGIDLEHVKEVATEKLGMEYPSQNQIVSYEAVSCDYAKQFEEIPE